MDKQFLEFWGNLLLQAARGQAQIESLTAWLDQSRGRDRFTELFKRIYNLDSTATPAGDYQAAWQAAIERFNAAYEGYLAMLNAVPRDRYRELEAQNASLRTEIDRQQQEIERLRRKRRTDGSDADDVVRDLQELLAKQQREFQDLTRQFKSFWDPKPSVGPTDSK